VVVVDEDDRVVVVVCVHCCRKPSSGAIMIFSLRLFLTFRTGPNLQDFVFLKKQQLQTPVAAI
jgi:hypothetical protein